MSDEPQRFQPGDPLSAAHLNSWLDYINGPQMGMPAGGEHLAAGRYGNAATSERPSQILMAYAKEDFERQVTDSRTAIEDDVKSGLCDFVHLDPATNKHVFEDSSRPYRVYDVVGSLIEDQTIRQGDVFSIFYNRATSRYEVLKGGVGGMQLFHGVVVEKCNEQCNTYRVRLVRRTMMIDCDSGSESDSESESI